MSPDILSLYQKNPWWGEKELILADDKLKEVAGRKFQFIHPLLSAFPENEPGVMTLRGPRQIGKTTLSKQIIKKLLLEDKVNPKGIFYYSLNTVSSFLELSDIINAYFQEFGETADFHYVFLDEISFVKEWQRTIKDFAESQWGKKTLFFLTGSSTVDLKFSSERLPGRRGNIKEKDIVFLPLLFKDFAKMVYPESRDWQKGREKLHLPKLKALFKDYLLTGGFPAVINEFYEKGFISSEIADIYTSWVIGDLHKFGKQEKTADLIFAKMISSLTTPVSYYELAKNAGLSSYVSAVEYVDLLTQMFSVFNLDYFELAQRKADYKKNHKFYFNDTFILMSFLAKIENMRDEQYSFTRKKLTEPVFLSHLVENLTAMHLWRIFPNLYYGRLKDREIDFIGRDKQKLSYFEVKFQNRVNPAEFSWFMDKFPKEKLTVVTKNDYLQRKNLCLIPVELFLFSMNL